MITKTSPAPFAPGDIVRFYRNGWRIGRVKDVTDKGICRVECLGVDPRTTVVRRFAADELKKEE